MNYGMSLVIVVIDKLHVSKALFIIDYEVFNILLITLSLVIIH